MHRIKAAEKHIVMKPWDICGRFLSGGIYSPSSHVSINEKIELYFNDHEFSYLMLQENYLKTQPDAVRALAPGSKQAKLKHLEMIDKAASSISDADLADSMIHGSQQQWSLMPTHAVLSCVLPASFVAGAGAGQYSFTSWLGNNSKAGKAWRLLRELQTHMRLRVSGDKEQIRQSYAPALFDQLVRRLSTEGSSAVPSIIEEMDSYFLTREDFDTLAELGLGPDNGATCLKALTTATKTAFTRQYNQGSHPVAFMPASQVIATKAAPSHEVPDVEDALEPSDDEADAPPDDADEADEETAPDFAKDKMVSVGGKGKKSSARKGKAAPKAKRK